MFLSVVLAARICLTEPLMRSSVGYISFTDEGTCAQRYPALALQEVDILPYLLE